MEGFETKCGFIGSEEKRPELGRFELLTSPAVPRPVGGNNFRVEPLEPEEILHPAVSPTTVPTL